MLALSLAAGPVLAEQPGAGNGATQTTQPSRSQPAPQDAEGPEVSPSRINGRADWDVDYPSQLAPQAFHSARGKGSVAPIAPTSCNNIDGCAP
jgi:hypothetical protein